MKQVVQNFRTGELKVEDLPPPLLRPGGVLVDTAYSLISAGTERTIVETAQSSLIGKARGRPDLVRQMFDSLKREGLRSTYQKVKARLDQIKALGYSASGVVVAVGEAVRGLQVGDRVACAGGGYASHAEVLFVPQNLCCRVPEGTPLESACYATVGSIALHGIRQAEVRLGETVAVIGLGLVGQLTVQLLKAAGCRVLGIDIDPAACELATRSGADMTSDTQSAVVSSSAFTEGRGADCIIVTAGTNSNEPIELAGQLARDRARVIVVGMVGMDVPRHVYYEKELDLRLSRSYGPGRYDSQYEEKGNDYPIGYVRWTEKRNMEAFLHLAAEGKIRIELLTTHRFSVERATDAYELITRKGGERYCGVVLEYPAAREVRAEPVKLILARSLSKDEIGVGFIGAGAFARGVLLPLVRRSAKVQLLGVSAATGVSAKNTAEQFGFSYATTEYDRILNDESTTCVFVATRHDSHARLAVEGLSRGKSVFVEKPLALGEVELSEVTAAVRKSGSLLMVGFNRRFAPLAREVKKRFAGRTGPMTIVYRVNAGQLPKDHWSLDATEGGGRIIGEVCHFIDFVQWMTDALPIRVSAESVSQPERTGFVDDSVAIAMRMGDGSVASIIYTASGDKSAGKEQIEIFCGGSIAMIDDFKSGHFINEGKRKKLGSGSQDKGHSAELHAFFEAVRGRTPPPISLESLVATSLTCFAIAQGVKGQRNSNDRDRASDGVTWICTLRKSPASPQERARSQACFAMESVRRTDMRSRVVSALILVGWLACAAMGQTSGKVVKAKAEQDGYRVKPGATLQAGVVIDIDSGYHINSNRPLDKFLVGTTFKIEQQAGITPGRVIYPKPKMQKFSFSEKPMSVYEGRAVLKFTIRALAGASPGTHTIEGKLTIQACNNEQCLRPQTISVEVPVEVGN